MGRWDEAQGLLQIAVSLEPTNAMAHASLVSAHAAKKKQHATLRGPEDYRKPSTSLKLNRQHRSG
jgi:uncharacterized protein YcnI